MILCKIKKLHLKKVVFSGFRGMKTLFELKFYIFFINVFLKNIFYIFFFFILMLKMVDSSNLNINFLLSTALTLHNKKKL